jgi:pyruvate-ferredoxin/flavodoxin oxidoreductase
MDESEFENNKYLANLRTNSDLLTTRSFWFIGGDGWAYDIGFAGID